MNKKIWVKLTVAYAKCDKCGFRRKLYFMSDFSYGERIIVSKSGERCAYVNLLEENITNEISTLCKGIFIEKNITISPVKMGRIVSTIYPITCDMIDGEEVDVTVNYKCNSCKAGKMVEDSSFGERIETIEMPLVTHIAWNKKNDMQKKQLIYATLETMNCV